MKKNVLKEVWERLVFSGAWFALGMFFMSLVKDGGGVLEWIIFVGLVVWDVILVVFVVLLSED